MASVLDGQTMTVAEYLALPDDDLDRDLIDGKVYVWGDIMNRRSRPHAYVSTKVASILANWLDTKPEPQGEVLTGDPAFHLRKDSTEVVCPDVAYISPEVASKNDDESSIIEGIPTLIVEIMSPSDTNKKVNLKVKNYLTGGVPLIWVINPAFRTITVFRPGTEPVMLNSTQRIENESLLPGLVLPVNALFPKPG